MIRIRNGFTRRKLLTTAASGGALSALGSLAKPYLSFAADRPSVSHGVQSGDVSTDSGMVWARADRPARMLVEIATTDSFKDIRHGVFVDALPETDLTAKALIDGRSAARLSMGLAIPPAAVRPAAADVRRNRRREIGWRSRMLMRPSRDSVSPAPCPWAVGQNACL